MNETNQLLIASGRHQSAVFWRRLQTQSVYALILSTREDWDDAYQPYLLTPVDSDGVALYDF